MDCQYTISEIDHAGSLLTQDPQNEDALEKLNSWRAFHTQFLDEIISKTLSNLVKNINEQKDFSISISSRPKRTTSIINKLQRLPRLRLSQIQDIVGIRYVVTPKNIQVNDSSWFTDFITKQKEYLPNYFTIKRTSNYIDRPRETGYRAVHFVLEYKNPEQPKFDNLQFELQIRTHYQHLWAMAVETIDMVYGKSLKTSKENDPEGWSDFFGYASALISCRENMPILEIHAQKNEITIRNELLQLEREKKFLTKLSLISEITEKPWAKDYDYWILEVNIKKRTPRALGFKADALKNAIALYDAREQNPDCLRGDVHVVLVSGQGFRDIRDAYPSYFLDIKDFFALVSSEK